MMECHLSKAKGQDNGIGCPALFFEEQIGGKEWKSC